MKKLVALLAENFLGILFLVGAASGFTLTVMGWWGLKQSETSLTALYQSGPARVARMHDIEEGLFGLQAQVQVMLSSPVAAQAEITVFDQIAGGLRDSIDERRRHDDMAHRPRWEEAARLFDQYVTQTRRTVAMSRGEDPRALNHHASAVLPYLLRVQQLLDQIESESLARTGTIYSDTLRQNRQMRWTVEGVALLATLLFCLTAWYSHRDEQDRREKTRLLNREQARFRALFQSTPDALVLLDRNGFLDYNQAAGALFDIASIEALRDRRLGELQPRFQPGGHHSEMDFLSRINNCLSFGSQEFEWTFRSLKGREFPAEVQASTVRLEQDDEIVQLTIRDISERKQAESQLRLSARVFENAIEGVVVTDENANLLLVNKAFTHITGYLPQEVVGRNPRMMKSGRHDAAFYRDLWDSLLTQGQWQGEIWNRRKNGEIYPQWLNINRVLDENAKVCNYVGIFSDISERKSAEEKILHQIYFDRLTDLPNRVLFVDRINQAIARCQRDDAHILALMHLDLDRFKIINDTFGHEAGDQLIKDVAARLQQCVRESDTVARITGDEFGLLLSPVAHAEDALSIANKIMDRFGEPFHVRGHEVFLTLSIGISVWPTDGANSEALLKNADMARYRAKNTGGMGCYLYDDTLRAWANDRLQLETALRRALPRDELVLYYQPQCDFQTGKLNGFEALIRWRHPELGLLSPDRFIPLAEETGQILEIGAWVLRQACRQAREWRDTGFDEVIVAVNFSSAQLLQPNIVEQVRATLDDAGLPAANLEIEITESAMMQDMDACVSVMNTLAEWGVQFAIDDFGTGYSSLAYLKKLPIHALKIDKAFLRDIDTDSDNAAIVSAIIAMSQKLGIKVVAEGIENASQIHFLTGSRGWEGSMAPVEVRGQGYLFGRPEPAESLLELVRRKNLLPPETPAG